MMDLLSLGRHVSLRKLNRRVLPPFSLTLGLFAQKLEDGGIYEEEEFESIPPKSNQSS